jgi:predicted O-methyltransferase YrrM
MLNAHTLEQVTQHIKRIPVIGPLAKMGYHSMHGLTHKLSKLPHTLSDGFTRRQLANAHYPQGQQLFHVLRQLRMSIPPVETDLIQEIENERSRLLLREEALVDGSLGEGGLYDKGQSIKAVCRVSKSPRSALFLYLMIREFKPLTVIELGTNVGISSAYLAAALQLNGPSGKLITLEASPYRLRSAKMLHKKLGLENVTYVEGLFYETLVQTLREAGTIDCAFVDGHHQYQPTLDYFQMIWKYSSRNALFVFDDIGWSDGMKRAWSALQADERIGLAVDLGSMGICRGARKSASPRLVLPPIYSALR